ncbi:MAG TPA: hypothetical protein VF730_03845 [Terracidiphilus sp.]
MDIATAMLSIWGGAGPLIGAGVSAWWANRNRVADREWGQRDKEQRLQREELAAARKVLQASESSALDWRRSTFIEFFSASHDFVWMQQGEKSFEVRERHRERFTKAFSVLMLLDQVSIGAETQAVWNACQAIVGAFPHTSSEQITELQMARAAFSAKASAIITGAYNLRVAQLSAAAGVPVACGGRNISREVLPQDTDLTNTNSASAVSD